jgi:hypothetical protein
MPSEIMISLRNQFHHAVNIGVTQWCCDGSMTDVQVELTASEANRLRKWGSLWFDLLHADMAMYERQNLPNTAANVFTRRALWESAVISYGRMQFSDKKRKLTHEDLLRAAGGEKALAFHERLSQWRHNHIAHRLSPEYETIAAAETGQPGLETLDLGVSTWIGPSDDSALAEEFREHVKALRDSLWQIYLAPIGEALVWRQPASVAAGPSFARLESDAEHLLVTCTLWARSYGTGV